MNISFQYNYDVGCVPWKDQVLRCLGWKVGRSWSSWCQDWQDSFGNTAYGSSFSERFLTIWQRKVSDGDWEKWEDGLGLGRGTITWNDKTRSISGALFYGLFSGAIRWSKEEGASLTTQIGLAKESVCFSLSVGKLDLPWLWADVKVSFCEEWRKKISLLWDRCLAYAAPSEVPELSYSSWVSSQCVHRGWVGMVEGQMGKGAVWGQLQLLDQEEGRFSICSVALKVGGVGMHIQGYVSAEDGLGVQGMIGLLSTDSA